MYGGLHPEACPQNAMRATCNPPADPPTLPVPLMPRPHTPQLCSGYLCALLKVTARASSRNDQQRSLAESRPSSVGKRDTAELRCSATYGKQKRLSVLACCRMDRRYASLKTFCRKLKTFKPGADVATASLRNP